MTTTTAAEPGRLIGTREVARMFAVSERTVVYWASRGKLTAVRTLGGHYRFRREDIEAVTQKAPTADARQEDKAQDGCPQPIEDERPTGAQKMKEGRASEDSEP